MYAYMDYYYYYKAMSMNMVNMGGVLCNDSILQWNILLKNHFFTVNFNLYRKWK